MTLAQVSIRDLKAGYGDETILDLDELDVREGEFISVLGPSGCGKTTLLNVIAGFVEPRAGRIEIDGRDVTAVPAHQRNLGLVFQNYALFPHMTIAQNIGYGLKVRRIGGAERSRRVADVLALVGLSDFASRRPRQLSGGQQQRVALARALAYEPSVLLLDEPLSNLDAKLRRQMQSELRQIQRRVGTTMIFVTHDQDEALTLSDRVALLNAGRVEQLGTPQEIYRSPRTAFAADFLGAGNLLPATVADERTVISHGVSLPVATDKPAGTEVIVVLRREHIALVPADRGPREAPRAVVTFRAFSGASWTLQVHLLTEAEPADGIADVELRDSASVSIELADQGQAVIPPGEGTQVRLTWEPETVMVIDQ